MRRSYQRPHAGNGLLRGLRPLFAHPDRWEYLSFLNARGPARSGRRPGRAGESTPSEPDPGNAGEGKRGPLFRADRSSRRPAHALEEHDERQRPVLRPRRARRRRGRRAAARVAQDPRAGLAARPPRADARDLAGRHARVVRRGEEPVDRRLRHLGPLHRSGRADRHPARAAGAARGLDRRARRHGRARRADVRLRARAARRPGARRHALRPPPQAAPREARRERDPDALRAPRHRDARDGVRRDPREPEARGSAAHAAGDRHAPASGAELRRGDPRRSSRPSSSATRSRAAARSSRATSTTRRASR